MKTYEEVLKDCALADERIVVMTAENRAAIRNLPPQLGERFIDVGIAEQTMIGAAAGLALRGRIPIVHALATFLTLRAFEFIRDDVGIARLPVKLVGGVPGFLSDGNGPTHQAIEDISLMRGIPNMQVFAPADMDDLTSTLPKIIASPEPCYIRYPAVTPTNIERTRHGICEAEPVASGSDVVILTYGLLLREAIVARNILEHEGISTGSLDIRWLKPLDSETVLDAVGSATLTVTLEDHFLTGGLFSILSELLVRHGKMANVLPLALEERWFKPALLPDVLEHEGFTGTQIAHRIRERMAVGRTEFARHTPISTSTTIMANTIQSSERYPVIEKSDALHARATGLIPAYTQTLAKGPGQYIDGVAPKYLERGNGSHVWDVDGNEYIDYNMGVGPLSLGYCYPIVDEAIRRQLELGITFSQPHRLEVEVAELICAVVPNAEMVRYSKTGGEVTTAAVRLARAYTGRDKVLCCGYHGWHDWYISVTDRNRGIPEAVRDLTYTFNYNDIESLIDSIDADTACVIMEPVVFEAPRDNFLQRVREVCEANGTLLIFDEMWTGFRLALGGAQEYFGVKSDLQCFSKAVANGMPISILSGRSEMMSMCDKDVFFFTTFGGEALSLAAAKATIEEIRDKQVPEYLAKQGRKLLTGYNQIAVELEMAYTRATGMDCRSLVSFDANAGSIPRGLGTGDATPLEMKSLVQQELIKRGILWSGMHVISFSHTDEDIAYTLSAYREVLPILRDAMESKTVRAKLRGKPVEPIFRKTSNFNTKPVLHSAARGE